MGIANESQERVDEGGGLSSAKCRDRNIFLQVESTPNLSVGLVTLDLRSPCLSDSPVNLHPHQQTCVQQGHFASLL